MLLSGNIFKMSNYKEVLRVHGLNDDDAQKMISDVVFFFLVADQKKTVIKVFAVFKHFCYLYFYAASVNKYVYCQFLLGFTSTSVIFNIHVVLLICLILKIILES